MANVITWYRALADGNWRTYYITAKTRLELCERIDQEIERGNITPQNGEVKIWEIGIPTYNACRELLFDLLTGEGPDDDLSNCDYCTVTEAPPYATKREYNSLKLEEVDFLR